jgi:hypothetical protein
MGNDTTYSITDLNEFAKSIRDGAARSISENYTENLDDFITVEQIKNLIEQNHIGYDSDGLLQINENIFDNLFDYIRYDIYQVALSRLAANGHIECAWDDNSNEMVFWIDSKSEGNKTINSLPSE